MSPGTVVWRITIIRGMAVATWAQTLSFVWGSDLIRHRWEAHERQAHHENAGVLIFNTTGRKEEFGNLHLIPCYHHAIV